MANESDYECPDCGGPMKLRSGKFGEFYGCKAYPDCTGTRRADGTANGAKRVKDPRPQQDTTKAYAQAVASQNSAPELDVEDTTHLVPPPSDEQPSSPTANEDGIDLPGPEPVDGSMIAPPSLVLDEHQQKVVDWRVGSALVAAGAGSGKSTVLVERIAALLKDGVLPEHIVTLVYNTSAAKDFKVKLSARLGEEIAQRVAASTFHGWAFKILKQWDPGNKAFKSDRIIGTPDGPNAYHIAGSVTKRLGLAGEVEAYLRASELIREALIDLESVTAIEEITRMRVTGHSTSAAERLHLFAREYQVEKETRNAIDFADMLYRVGRDIRRDTTRAEKLAGLYEHVQVDEAQDINVARMTIAVRLAKGAKSFVCVGDMRQSVYGFTGARPDLFKGLLRSCGGDAELLTLPVNRRSTAAVVNAGNIIAALRDWNLGGACSPSSTAGKGEPVQLWRVSDTEMSEGSLVAEEIRARTVTEIPLADEKGKANYVILTRTNAQAAGFEAALIARGLPVRVLGTSGGVWTTTAGREFRAYLAAVEGRPVDDIVRIANKPVRYLKGEDVKSAINWVKKGTIGLEEALRAVARQKNPYRNPPRHGAWDLAEDLAVLRTAKWLDRCKAVSQFLIMDLEERARQDEAGDAAGKVMKPDEDKKATYEALAEAATDIGSLDKIEEQIKQVKKDEGGPAVEISTMHKAKGMEWHTVFVTGVADGILPHEKAEDEEEERRLFYVAVTRAKRACIVSAGSVEPSPFFMELQAALSPNELPPKGHEPAPLLSDKTVVTAPSADVKCNLEVVADGEKRQDTCPYNEWCEWPGGPCLKSYAPGTELYTIREAAKIEAATPPPTLVGKLAETYASIAVIRILAAEQGEKERPAAAIVAGPGSRFVNVSVEDMEGLLGAIGFTNASKDVTMKAHQRVFELGFPPRGKGYYTIVRVYSTIPLGDDLARELGEDSIKIVAFRVHDEDGRLQPLHKKLPYACRTRNWRTTLLDKIEEVLGIIETREGLTKKEV